tara:strand:- start:61374 stop:63476 length:2103 start_codon:yes stop_codon:yes gene_type:complete
MGFDRIVVGLGIVGACLFGNVGCGDNSQETLCGTGTTKIAGECRPTEAVCGVGTVYDEASELCIAGPLECARGTVADGDQCIPDGSVICDEGTTYDAVSGQCQSDITACGPGTVLDGLTCVPLDDAIDASLEEALEPNNDFGLAGSLDVPSLTGTRTIYGCIDPRDFDSNGTIDIDRDSYRLTATGPSLVEIAVDGIGGLSGAFVIRATSGALAEDDWSRTGLNLVSDTSIRQVFLPAAGDYLLDIVDGRSLLVPEPVGNGDTCYLASIRHLALPTATSLSAATTSTPLTGGVQLFSISANADGDLLQDFLQLSAPTAAASLAMVHMRAGRYAGGVQGTGSLSDRTSGLQTASNLLVVVEPEFNYALDPVFFDYSFARFSAPQLANGTPTQVSVGATLGFEVAWTPVVAGDIVRLQVDNADVTVFSLNRRMARKTQLCDGCSNSEFFYQATESGLLYLGISNASAAGSFTVTFEHLGETPSTLEVGIPNAAVALGEAGYSYWQAFEEPLSWSTLTADPTAFSGDLLARRYARDTAGFLDAELTPLESIVLTGASPRNHLAISASDSLWRIEDTGFDGNSDTESYDLSLTPLAFTILEPTSGSPVELTAVAIVGDEPHRFLLSAAVGDEVDLSVSTADAIDLSITQLSEFESATAVQNAGNVGETELVRAIIPATGYLPFSVQTAGESGAYALSAEIVAMP